MASPWPPPFRRDLCAAVIERGCCEHGEDVHRLYSGYRDGLLYYPGQCDECHPSTLLPYHLWRAPVICGHREDNHREGGWTMVNEEADWMPDYCVGCGVEDEHAFTGGMSE